MSVDPARVRMIDIARKVGVTHATVSLALSHSPQISERTRRLIRKTADEMGYRPDPMLTAFANYRRSKSKIPSGASIGFIKSRSESPGCRMCRETDLYWKGAEAAAKKGGYKLEQFDPGGPETSAQVHANLNAMRIRGLLLSPEPLPESWHDFPWHEYIVVKLGHSPRIPHLQVVAADHLGNALLAVEEIRNRGYSRIGFITDRPGVRRDGDPTLSGFEVAQSTLDPGRKLPVLFLGDTAAPDRQAATRKWLLNHQPDAVYTDLESVPPLLEKSPMDLGLAVSNTLGSDTLSGINPQFQEIGRVGFLTLNSILTGNTCGIPPVASQILIEGAWVGGVTTPPRSVPAKRTVARRLRANLI